MSAINPPYAKWNRLSAPLGFLVAELFVFSAKDDLEFSAMIWMSVGTLAAFGACFLLEDYLRKRGRKTALVLFQIVFGLAFAGALLLLLKKLVS